MRTTKYNGISAVVLCGGRSARAGIDKQTIRIGGELIAEWIADVLETVFQEVILVTNRPGLYAISRRRIVSDIIVNAGPLGGIHAGLLAARNEMVFVTACDMPNVNVSYLRWLSSKVQHEAASFDAAALRLDNGMLEPMNAIYSKNCLPRITRMLANGERKIADLLLRQNTYFFTETEIERFGGKKRLFFNMNTPQEIQDYLNRINTPKQSDETTISKAEGDLNRTI